MLDYPLVTARTPIGAKVALEAEAPPFYDTGTVYGHPDASHVQVWWPMAGLFASYANDQLQVLPDVRPAIFTGSAGR